jgi:hypothetical protein
MGSDFRFRFYYDLERPEELHVNVRHGTSLEEVIQTYFDGEGVWNAEHKRFETATGTHVLYWARHPIDGSVLVITCFRRGDA